MLQSYANSWSRGTVFDCAHSSRALGRRKVQHRTDRGIVELSAPRGEAGQTWYSRRSLDGMPSPSPSLASNQSPDVDSVDEFGCPRESHRHRRRRDLPNRPHHPSNLPLHGSPKYCRNHQHRRRVERTTVPTDNHSIHEVEFHFDWSVQFTRVVCVLLNLPGSSRALTKITPVDKDGFLMFYRQLSQLYQGLRPIDPLPHYETKAIKFPEPLKPPFPPYYRFDPSDPPPWEQPEWRAPESVVLRLTAAQLTEIQKSVTKGMEHPRITSMDIVVGLLARCLSEVELESKPIDTIAYVVNVRTSLASPVP